MKKFKILENSRFLNNQDMDKLQGGTVCNVINIYSNCENGSYTVCKARSSLGFVSVDCVGTGANSYIMCGADMYYATQSCPSGSNKYSGENCNTPSTGYRIV